jgi:hypothetical protein
MTSRHCQYLHVHGESLSLFSVESGGRARVKVHVHFDIQRVYLLGSRGPLPRNVQTRIGCSPNDIDFPANGVRPRLKTSPWVLSGSCMLFGIDMHVEVGSIETEILMAIGRLGCSI